MIDGQDCWCDENGEADSEINKSHDPHNARRGQAYSAKRTVLDLLLFLSFKFILTITSAHKEIRCISSSSNNIPCLIFP